MNLAPAGSGDNDPPLAPPEWTMNLGIDHSGTVSLYYAEVMKGGNRMCRLSLASPSRSEEEARAALARKARAWIAEHLSRPRADGATSDTVGEMR